MGIRLNKDTGCFEVEEQLLVDKEDGIISCDSSDEPENSNQRAVEIKLVLPKNFFDPVKINVDFPPELLADKAVDGYVNQVEVPVEIGGKRGNVKMEEALRDGRGSGVLSLIKKFM